jgi:predicted  nucleic acid-binding Zn-ribbon protein
MAQFRHHSYYPKEREVQQYLFPHVCFHCRKSFKKPAQQELRKCPECAGPLTRLSRKFKAPKTSDKSQWEKVKFLVEHGFLFYSVYERTEIGEVRVPYPKTLAEAHTFVATGNKREARGA